MKVTGIIAEYNPFHNGRKYQLEQVRKRTDADYIIIAMSGDFLQRGVPALSDKHTRARMALSAGADLVLELPTVWATSSAEYFAAGGVALLERPVSSIISVTGARLWIQICFMQSSLCFLQTLLQVPANFRNISLLF